MRDAMAAAECIDDLKEAGLSYDQARLLVEFIVRSQEHLATKEDIKALEIRIDGLEARIDGLEARIDSLGARIDGLEARIDSFGARIDGLEARIDSFGARIDGLDVKIGAQGVTIKSLAAEMKAFEARFTRQLYFFGFGIVGSMIAIMGLFLALLSQMQLLG